MISDGVSGMAGTIPGIKTRLASVCDVLIEAGWLMVIIGVPLVFNPLGENRYNLYKVALLSSVVGVMVACWLIKTVFDETARKASLKQQMGRFWGTPLVIPALALAAAYLLATLTSVSPFISFWGSLGRMMGTYTILLVIVFFLVTAFHLRSRSQINRLIWAAIASSCLVCLFGLAEWLGWTPFLRGGYGDWRVGSTLSYPIFLGAYLVLTLPLTTARLISAFSSRDSLMVRVGLSLVLLLQLGTLVLTNARGPWLGFALAALVFGLALALRQHRSRLLVASASLGFLAVMFSLGLSLPQSPIHKLSHLPYLSRLSEAADMDSTSVRGRLFIWGATAELVKDHPPVGLTPDRINAVRTLLGYGPETLAYTFNAVYPPELRRIESYKIVDRAHNNLLQLTATVGIIGLVCFLFFVVSFFYLTIRWLRRSSTASDQLILVALLAAVSGHLLEQMFGMANPADQVQLWAYAALLVAFIRLNRRAELPGDNTPHSQRLSRNEAGAKRKLVQVASRWFLVLVGVLGLIVLSSYLNINAVRADFEARRGTDLVEKQAWGDAVIAFARAIKFNPNRALYHWHLAGVYFIRAQELPDEYAKELLFTETIKRLEAAKGLEPLNADYYRRTAQTYAFWESMLTVTKYEAAVESYRQASQLRPFDVRLLNEWAILEADHKNYESALARLNTSLEIDPCWGPTYHAQGLVHQQMGNVDAAVLAYRKAAEFSPELQQTYQQITDNLLAQME